MTTTTKNHYHHHVQQEELPNSVSQTHSFTRGNQQHTVTTHAQTLVKRRLEVSVSSSPAPSLPAMNYSRLEGATSTLSVRSGYLHAASVAAPLPEPEWKNGFIFEYFPGEYNFLPDFEALSYESVGVLPSLKLDQSTEPALLDPSGRRSLLDIGNYALRLSFMVDLPESGTYTFSLTSNDGSALYIGGKQIVNNDGCHYSTEKEGSAYLEAGRQSLAVGYFHKNGKLLEGIRAGPILSLSYSCEPTDHTPGMLGSFAKSISGVLVPALHSAESNDTLNQDFRVASRVKAPIPLEWSWYDANDVRLRGDMVRERPISSMQGESRARLMEKSLSDLQFHYGNRLTTLQEMLSMEEDENYRIVSSLKNMTIFKEEEDEIEDDDQRPDVNQVLFKLGTDIERLKEMYFMSSGLAIKLLNGGEATMNLQELWQDVREHNVPVNEWGKVLANPDSLRRM